MGKKRRIISSPRKFANKHRHFLDALDGVMDGKVSAINAYIRDVQVIDLGNQTIAISCSIDGDFDSGDRVKYYIDDFGEAADAMTIVTGSGRYVASSSLPAITGAATPPSPTGSILSPGAHQITCRYISGSVTGSGNAQSVSTNFTVSEAKVKLHSGSSNGPIVSDISPWLTITRPNGGYLVTFGELDSDLHPAGKGPGDSSWAKLTHGYELYVTGTEYVSSSIGLTSATHAFSASAGAGTYTVEFRPVGKTMLGYLTSSVVSGTVTIS